MWLFSQRKSRQDKANLEAEIKAIRDTKKTKVERAIQKTTEVSEKIESDAEKGTTYMLFLAMGGERRHHGKR